MDVYKFLGQRPKLVHLESRSTATPMRVMFEAEVYRQEQGA
jgi:hypothetical protein